MYTTTTISILLLYAYYNCITCVNVGVFLHVGLLVEPFPTILARVGPRVRVYEEVRGQGGAPLEGLAALLARERLLAVVNRSVGETTAGESLKRQNYVTEI